MAYAPRSKCRSVLQSLLQIGSNYIDQFFGSLCLGRVLAAVGERTWKSDVSLHDFGHQTIQRPTAGSHELKDTGAFLLGVERPLDGVDLPTNASNTRQKLFFVFACVSHIFTILYPSIV